MYISQSGTQSCSHNLQNSDKPNVFGDKTIRAHTHTHTHTHTHHWTFLSTEHCVWKHSNKHRHQGGWNPESKLGYWTNTIQMFALFLWMPLVPSFEGRFFGFAAQTRRAALSFSFCKQCVDCRRDSAWIPTFHASRVSRSTIYVRTRKVHNEHFSAEGKNLLYMIKFLNISGWLHENRKRILSRWQTKSPIFIFSVIWKQDCCTTLADIVQPEPISESSIGHWT